MKMTTAGWNENQEKVIQHIENKLPSLLFETDEMGYSRVYTEGVYYDIRWLINKLKSTIDENKRLREALNEITDLELFVGKSREYYQDLALQAFCIASNALGGGKNDDR